MRTLKRLLASGTAVSIGLVSLLLGSLAAQGVSATLPVVFVCVAIFSYVVIATGKLLLHASGAPNLSLVAAWPLGVTATGIVLWALTALLDVSAATALALWAALVILLDLATGTRKPVGLGQHRTDLIGLLLCCAFTAAWCKDLARAPIVLAQTGVLPAWVDYFVHGGVIAQFGDPRAIGRGVLSLADFPIAFYHYASYVPAAAFALPLDQSGLPIATSLWIPIGFLSLAAAAYSLGVALAGAAGGVAALIALFAMPDAAGYGLQNGFFSFHWNLLAASGASYGLASALLAVVFLKHWADTGPRAALLASIALVGATFLTRFQIFLLLFPAWLAAVAIVSPRARRNLKLILSGTALFLIAAILVHEHLPDLRGSSSSWAFDEGQALDRFLYQVHTRQSPTAYPGLYTRVRIQYGDGIGFALGIMLVYAAALGVLLLLFPAALALERRSLQLKGIDAFPLALLALYAMLMMFAPTPSQHDATELIHRPFVLLYAVTAIWTVALAARWLSRQGAHGARRTWQTIVIAAAVALPWIWSSATEMGRPKFNWGRQFNAYPAGIDLVAAAAFVRAHARPGDVLATTRQPSIQTPVDPATVLTALTSTPAYLARTWYHVSLGGNRSALAIDRYNMLGTIERTPDRQVALARLGEMKVRWYVATALGTPAWDPQHAHASYAHGSVAVYRTTP